MVAPALSLRRPTKQANFAADFEAREQAKLRNEVLKNVAGTTLAALGLGAAGRGTVGLLGMLRQNLAEPPKSRMGPVYVKLPVPVRRPRPRPKRQEEEEELEPVVKLAILGTPEKTTEVGYNRLLHGLGALGGFAGGWKLTDWLLSRRRKAELEKELEDSRREFRGALVSQFDHPVKVADDQTLGPLLDRLYDGFSKLASEVLRPSAGTEVDSNDQSRSVKLANDKDKGIWDSVIGGGQSMLRELGSGYTAYAGLAALLTGLAGYDVAKRRGHQALLQKAVERRQREQYSRRPPELFVSPVAVPIRDEEDEDPRPPRLPRLPTSKLAAAMIPSRLVRELAPLVNRRETLEPEEEAAIGVGESQWWGKLVPNDSTPISEMMASPTRQGLLAGVATGAPAAAAGHYLGDLAGRPEAGALIGGLGVGGLTAVLRAFQQHRKNQNLRESIRRLPPGATMRDFNTAASIRETLMNRLVAMRGLPPTKR